MTAGWCTRTIRAAVFAAVCVLLAALGHVLMSGRQVPVWALVGGVAVTAVVGWVLAARERGLPLIVTVVVAAQTGLHSAFSAAQSTPARDMGAGHMHSMDAMDVRHMDHGGSMMAAADSSSSFGMLAAHLLAALLCGLWLAYGERAAFRILRAVAGWLVAPLRLLLALPAPPERPRLHADRRRADRVPRLLLAHAITSRGPPAGFAVA
ncbi:hypothetical protein BN159_3945 [Streptomyces davaonensis JCM 4913]|uniref:Integral-membrane protein n=1 Tax=Streptomyces davaonensis (strain DSM 101723 / JCM 4913 / KCC S-0913 / 768) TaxID=1214101 RepID=K4R6L2_STRDJ|nr:hypothetical protein [Streptomyces davaonensis]CCK28324.1 hypothetical protein BN159_3945 [Streptomyces davaonensis JCM 4913]